MHTQFGCFGFSINFSDRLTNKKDILSLSVFEYGPLGLIVPLLLALRRTLQQLCCKNCEWDETVDESLSSSFETWLEGITDVEILRIPRCLSIEPCVKGPISNASESSCGAVAYMRL